MSGLSFENSAMRKELEDYEDLLSNRDNSKTFDQHASSERTNNKSKFGGTAAANKIAKLEVSMNIQNSKLLTSTVVDACQLKSQDFDHEDPEEAYYRELAAFERANNIKSPNNSKVATIQELPKVPERRLHARSNLHQNNGFEADKSNFTMKWDISSISMYNSQINRVTQLLVSIGFGNAECCELRRIKRQESEVINTDMALVQEEDESIANTVDQPPVSSKRVRSMRKTCYVIQDTIRFLIPSKTALLRATNQLASTTEKSKTRKVKKSVNKNTNLSSKEKSGSQIKDRKKSSKIRQAQHLNTNETNTMKQMTPNNKSTLLGQSQFASMFESKIQKNKHDRTETDINRNRKHSINASLNVVLSIKPSKFTITKAVMAEHNLKTCKTEAQDSVYNDRLNKLDTDTSNMGIKLKPTNKQPVNPSVRLIKTEKNHGNLIKSGFVNSPTSAKNVRVPVFKKQKVSTVCPVPNRPAKSVSKSFTGKQSRSHSVTKKPVTTIKSKTPVTNKKLASILTGQDYDTIKSKYETALSDLEAFNYKMNQKLTSVMSENQKLKEIISNKSSDKHLNSEKEMNFNRVNGNTGKVVSSMHGRC